MAEEILKHVLEYFDTLEGGQKILNVVIDLPINPSSPGFKAEALDALCRELAKTEGWRLYRRRPAFETLRKATWRDVGGYRPTDR
jgi:hypothetical protein